jgi:hypothetical protein
MEQEWAVVNKDSNSVFLDRSFPTQEKAQEAILLYSVYFVIPDVKIIPNNEVKITLKTLS